jgi:hypothetical protein
MRSLFLIVAAAGCALACSKTQAEPLGEGDSGGDSGEAAGAAGRAIAGANGMRDEAGGEAGAGDMTAAGGSPETSSRGAAGTSGRTQGAGGAETSRGGTAGSSGRTTAGGGTAGSSGRTAAGGGSAGSSGRTTAEGGSETSSRGAAGAGPSSAGAAGAAGSATSFGNGTCMDVLTCIGDCPDADQGCPDGCYATGSEAGQNQLLALLTCMDDAACVDVTCIESSCDPELNTCLGDSTTASGTPNPSGDVPDGDIPSELVGHWTSPGSSEVTEFTFNADGTATYSAYKESGIGTCSMSVVSQWNTGSATVQGDLLTVTLADGTTSVAWDGGCGTGYTNPTGGKIFEFSYALDDSRSPPGLWLTDLSCTGDACQAYYRKDGG